VRCRAASDELIPTLTGDEATGASIVRKSLSEPLRWIAKNAGLEGPVMVQQVERETGNTGLNAATGQFEDLLKAGKAPRQTLGDIQGAAGELVQVLNHLA